MRDQIIFKLKYVFTALPDTQVSPNTALPDEHASPNTALPDTQASPNTALPDTQASPNIALPDTQASQDAHESKIIESAIMFKKINILFSAMSDILKYNITKIDGDKYKKVADEQVMFPKNLDSLIIIMGCYSDAFNEDVHQDLYNIVDLSFYESFYNISQINSSMIPFIVNDEIDSDKLKVDYNIFAEKVLNFVCNTLNVNTDLDDEFLIEQE